MIIFIDANKFCCYPSFYMPQIHYFLKKVKVLSHLICRDSRSLEVFNGIKNGSVWQVG